MTQHAVNGTLIGRRGARTRRRLLEATESCLLQRGLLGLRVVEIASVAETSPATFYHYFRSPIDALLVRAEEAGEDLVPIRDLIGDPSGSEGVEQTRRLVVRFFDHWDRHRALLRARNLAAQEGDPRFREVRNRSLSPLTERLAQQIARAQQAQRLPEHLDANIAAAALVAMLERMAAFRPDLEQRYGTGPESVVDTVAEMLWAALTGVGTVHHNLAMSSLDGTPDVDIDESSVLA